MNTAVGKVDTACGRRVCAWCVPMRDLGPAPLLPAGTQTHGICDECLRREFAADSIPKYEHKTS